MQISDRGLLEIAEHEGIVPAPYLDSVGVWTWGIGHTAAAGGPNPATMLRTMPNDLDSVIDAAIRQFRIDVAGYDRRVNDAIKVPLEQHQHDALVSFDLNTGGIYRAKLTAAINRGDPAAADHFMGWLKPPEIRTRRTAEQRLYRTGDYDHNGDKIAIWRTNGAGKLTGILKTISGRELLARFAAVSAPTVLAPMADETPATTAWARVVATGTAHAEAVADYGKIIAA